MSNIDKLKSLVERTGFARTNHFKVSIPWIGGLDPTFDALAESVTMPGRTLTTQEYTNEKETLKYVYGYIDTEVTATFLLTKDYVVRQIFDVWMESIVDTTNYTLGYKSDYAQDVLITQLDRNHNKVYEVKLINAYPTNMSAIELSNAGNDVSKLTVTFSYDKYEVVNK